MKNVQIELTDEQYAQVRQILSTRGDRSEKEIVDLIVERGIYALLYRTRYNKVKYEREKEIREEFKQYKAAKATGSLSSVASVVAVAKK